MSVYHQGGVAGGPRFLGGGDIVGGGATASVGPVNISPEEKERLYTCILQLASPTTREEALQELR